MIGDTLHYFNYTTYYKWNIKTDNGWDSGTSVTQGTTNKQCCVINDVLYMFSWYYKSSAYTFYFLKVDNGVITTLSTANVTQGGKFFAYNGYIWLVGLGDNAPVFRYTISTNTWTQMGFTTPFVNHGAQGSRWVVWNGYAYVFERTGNASYSFFRFNGSSFTNLGITAFNVTDTGYSLGVWSNLFVNNNKLYCYY